MEAKTELWSQYSGAGYKYTSCYTTEKYVIIGSPDSILYCLDKVTGEEVQRIALEEGVGGVSTGISYSNGRIYFGTVTAIRCTARRWSTKTGFIWGCVSQFRETATGFR